MHTLFGHLLGGCVVCMVESICQGSNASKLRVVAFIYTAHIHLHAFEVHQSRVFCIVPARWSRDKAADHMLDSIGHRCARTDHRENVTACPQDVDAYF